MKTKITLLASAITLLTISNNCFAQQDTTKVVTHDTTRVIEKTQVVHDTVPRTQVVHDTVAVKKDKDQDEFKVGEFGVRFLPTFTTLSFNTSSGGVVQGNVVANYGYGVMLGLNFSRYVGIMAEVDYLDISQKYKDQELEKQVHLNYLNIPVMLSLNTNKSKPVNLNVVVGPQFGVNVGSSVNSSSNSNTTTTQATLAVKQGDIGIAYGAGFEFAFTRSHALRLDLGFRGMYGLVDISGDNTGPNTYNVLVHASRKSYGGYIGLAFAF